MDKNGAHKRLSRTLGLLGILLFVGFLHSEPALAQADTEWYTVAANPQRTSAVASSPSNVTEIKAVVRPEWFFHIPPYISAKVQLITTNDTVYVSSSRGLYAVKTTGVTYDQTTREAPASSALKWIYCTSTESKITTGECPSDELPLGNSPTVINGVAYVGGFDKRIHAINANTGDKIWVSTPADAGFHTNPLVVEVAGQGWRVIAGNRDGKLYFYDANPSNTSQPVAPLGTFTTGGPILVSPAFKNNIVYFASNDMHAYAVNAATRQQVWKSAKFPGVGFHSYWPVVTTQRDPNGMTKDYVIFQGVNSWGIMTGDQPGQETGDLYGTPPQGMIGPTGTVSASDPWTIVGTETIDVSKIADYLEAKPWRRTYFVLNTSDGKEYQFDYDGDGGKEYAPFPYVGGKQGTRYPPVIGPDSILYQRQSYIGAGISRGGLVGWKFGTTTVSIPGEEYAIDEATAHSFGGSVFYFKLQGDNSAAGYDISTPQKDRWQYFGYGWPSVLAAKIPEVYKTEWPYAYWKTGDQTPPIPYKGKIYIRANNSVIAFNPNTPKDEYLNDLGYNTGRDAATVEKTTLIPSAFGNVTAESTTWPTLLYQENYVTWDTVTRAKFFPAYSVSGVESGSPTGLTPQQNPDTATVLTTTYTGGTLTTRVSPKTPTILFENTSNTYVLNGSIKGIAYKDATGATRQVNPSSNPPTISGTNMSEGWLLIWDDDTAKSLVMSGSIPANNQPQLNRWHPMVIALEKQPSQVELTSTGLKITYSGPAGYLTATPLKGMSAPVPGKTYYTSDRSNTELNSWKSGNFTVNGFNAITKAQQIAEISRSFPTAWTDSTTIVGTNAEVKTQYTSRIEFSSWQGALPKSPKKVAFISPNLALASWNTPTTLMTLSGTRLDLEYPLPLGRWAGVANTDTVTVTLQNITKYWKTPLPTPAVPQAGDPVQAKLAIEVQKMLDAGHLRPGYVPHGLLHNINGRNGEWLDEYFHNPADTITTLLQALPLLPSTMHSQARQYIQSEYQGFSPETVVHMGYKLQQPGRPDGARREDSDLIPEFEASFLTTAWVDYADSRSTVKWDARFQSWNYNPISFYSMALYAKEFGGADTIFDNVETKLDDYIATYGFRTSMPYVLNHYISGYIGYLKLANLTTTQKSQPAVEKRLIDFLILRAALSKNTKSLEQSGFEYGNYHWIVDTYQLPLGEIKFQPYKIGTVWIQHENAYGWRYLSHSILPGPDSGGGYGFNIDFIGMTPELGQFMHDFVGQEMQAQVSSYNKSGAYWFVNKAEEAGGEGTLMPLQETIALFQAKAYGLQESRQQLEPYLDVPAFDKGDLYYIQKLIGILQAPTTANPTVCLGDTNLDRARDLSDVIRCIRHLVSFETLTGNELLAADANQDGSVDLADVIRIIRDLLGLEPLPVCQ